MYFPMILDSNYVLELKASKNELKLMQLYSQLYFEKIGQNRG